jgi:predicted Fe-Mo cluster-binding NifX family protein
MPRWVCGQGSTEASAREGPPMGGCPGNSTTIRRENMKIAVVTDDGKTISAHFGRAAYYSVVTVDDGKVIGQEQRAKPAHDHQHHHNQGTSIQLQEASGGDVPDPQANHTHGAMVEPIQDCQVLLSRGMGSPAYESLRAAGIQPIITDVREIDEAVRQYLKGELVDHPERLH